MGDVIIGVAVLAFFALLAYFGYRLIRLYQERCLAEVEARKWEAMHRTVEGP